MIPIIIILLVCISIGSWVYSYSLYRHDRQIIEINSIRQQENESLEREILARQSELNNLKIVIDNQNNVLQSLNSTVDSLQVNAKKRAQEVYEEKVMSLYQQYQQEEKRLHDELQHKSKNILDKIAIEQDKLNSLEEKQLAYIQAQLRQEEIASNQDYYRLVINDIDLNDVTMLRELQLKFFKKEIIDKLIWETYFKPAYDILMSHLFKNSDKTCGIYKITDLVTGQSYIGQSVDIKERFRQHIKTSLSYGVTSNKLYQMMQKSGQQNFTFEILEEVPRTKLNERETYWIEFYKTKDYGLNSTRGNA